MNRRRFLQGIAISTVELETGSLRGENSPLHSGGASFPVEEAQGARKPLATEGLTYMAEFPLGSASWKVLEDLETRDGPLVFVSSQGRQHVFTKTAEALAATGTPYFGLDLEQVTNHLPDVLAEHILANGGDPDPEEVKSAIPPIVWAIRGWGPPMWLMPDTTFIGTVESLDVEPVHYDGSTETFFTTQYAPQIGELVKKGQVFDGLVGGWLPIIRKVFPLSEKSYWEVLVFPDVERCEQFIVHSWHRIAHIQNGRVTTVIYGHSYPPYPPRRQNPAPEAFYRALLVSAEYWESHLRGLISVSLPQNDWVDLCKHSFVKELMARPGGVYPRYGTLDRDYGGCDDDAFQDTFTSAVYTNLEWGRFATAKSFIDNYFGEFVDSQGLVMMRGPETGQYGLMLSLMARYFNYTGEHELLAKHYSKIQAIANLLRELHDESLRLPAGDPGYGLIHGWSESDSSFRADPARYWQPYFGNSAFASRGFKDLGEAWLKISQIHANAALRKEGSELLQRSRKLQEAVISSIQKSVRREMNPPYVACLPGMQRTFYEELQQDQEGPQRYAARAYIELLQADVIPPELSNLIIDCMRAYGATTLGIPFDPNLEGGNRKMLAFISYGYAQTLLRLDRVEEFLLFLYAHRYHCHRRGHWTAAELASIARGPQNTVAPYCTPAQQVIPLLIRWMLVLEDSDSDRLYLCRGVPRQWLASGRDVGIEQAPTRWGRVSVSLKTTLETKTIAGNVELERPGAPGEFHLKFRLPQANRLQEVSINGRVASLSGPQHDIVVVQTQNQKHFSVSAHLS
jgi:hypothetical protein